MLLAEEEYYMQMLSTLFCSNDYVNSLDINLKTYDFKQCNSLNTHFFSYAHPRK